MRAISPTCINFKINPIRTFEAVNGRFLQLTLSRIKEGFVIQEAMQPLSSKSALIVDSAIESGRAWGKVFLENNASRPGLKKSRISLI
jgi:hypothetical protein